MLMFTKKRSPVNARVVDLGHGVPRLGLLGKEEEAVDFGLVHLF